MDYLNKFGSSPQPPRLRSLQAAADSPNLRNNVMLSATAARAAGGPCRSSSAARASADALGCSPSCGTEPDQFYDAPDAFQPATKPPQAQHRYASRGSRLGDRIAAFGLDKGSDAATAATAAAAAATGSALPAEWITRSAAAVAAVARGPAITRPESAAGDCVRQMQQDGGGANGRLNGRQYAGEGTQDGVGNSNGGGGGFRRGGSGVPVRPGCGRPMTEASPMVDSVLLAGRVGELRTLGQEFVARLMKVQDAKANLHRMEEVLQEELQAVRQAVADELERLRIQGQRMASDGVAEVMPSSDDAAAATGAAAAAVSHNDDVSSQLALPLGGAGTRMSSYSEAALSGSPSYISESGASQRGQRSTARQSSEPSAANSDAPASPQLQPQQQPLLPPQPQQPILTAPQGLPQGEPNAQVDPRLSSLSAVQLLQAALARAASVAQPAPSGDGQEAQLLTALSQLLQSPRPAVPELGRPGLAAPVPAPLPRMDAVAPSIDELYGKAAMAAATAAEAAAYVAPALDYAVQLMQEAAARSGRPPRLADHQAPGRPLLLQPASTAQGGRLDGTEQVDRRLAAAVTAAVAKAVAGGYVGDGGLRGWAGVYPGTGQRSVCPDPAATGWQQRAVVSGPPGLEPTTGGTELQALLRLLGLHEQQQAPQRLQAPWPQQQQQQEPHSLLTAGTSAYPQDQPRMAAGASRGTSPLQQFDIHGYQQQQAAPQRLLPPPWQQRREYQKHTLQQQQLLQTPGHDDPWVGPPYAQPSAAAGAQLLRPGGPWTAGTEQAPVGVQAGAEPDAKRRRVAAGHGS